MTFKISSKGIWINGTLAGHCFDEALCAAIATYVRKMKWNSVVDLGCGPGWYVKGLRISGMETAGYDGNPYTEVVSQKKLGDGTFCERLDLTEKIRLNRIYDCVLSLEVGEHIPTQYECIFLDNLTSASNSCIVLSWAIPGQSGDGHVNCRSNEYIISKLLERGFKEDIPAKNYLRLKASLDWFKSSLMVFIR